MRCLSAFKTGSIPSQQACVRSRLNAAGLSSDRLGGTCSILYKDRAKRSHFKSLQSTLPYKKFFLAIVNKINMFDNICAVFV